MERLTIYLGNDDLTREEETRNVGSSFERKYLKGWYNDIGWGVWGCMSDTDLETPVYLKCIK